MTSNHHHTQKQSILLNLFYIFTAEVPCIYMSSHKLPNLSALHCLQFDNCTLPLKKRPIASISVTECMSMSDHWVYVSVRALSVCPYVRALCVCQCWVCVSMSEHWVYVSAECVSVCQSMGVCQYVRALCVCQCSACVSMSKHWVYVSAECISVCQSTESMSVCQSTECMLVLSVCQCVQMLRVSILWCLVALWCQSSASNWRQV